jgi:hypothetical protein
MAVHRDISDAIHNERKYFVVTLAQFNQPNGANAK